MIAYFGKLSTSYESQKVGKIYTEGGEEWA